MKNKIKKMLSLMGAVLAVAWSSAILSGCACMDMPHHGCEVRTCVVEAEKHVPADATVGETLSYKIKVHAKKQCTNVVLTEEISGAAFVKSEPAATVNGNILSWRFDNLKSKENRDVTLWLKAETDGQIMMCTSISGDPQCCDVIPVGRAALSISKNGPATANFGENVTYTIVVHNTGTMVAKNVVVTDNVPAGFVEESGKNSLSYNLGDMAPNESKEVKATFKSSQHGRICNSATATSTNAGEVSGEACTNITQASIAVSKTGDAVEYVTKKTNYAIIVTNTGDTDLTNVVVTDNAPEGTTMVAAEGAQISGSQATWNIPHLKAGENVHASTVLKGETAGNHCNQVSVSCSEGVTAKSEACTLWKGLAGLVNAVADTVDPIKVGETTTYTIEIANQGSADAHNVGITMTFPREIKPIRASGATSGTVDGQTVTFTKHPVLARQDVIHFSVDAEGVAPGDIHPEVSMTADELEKPVIEQESTHVY